jgi:drug/metabolite transporter (DMT)-like permease
LLEAVYFMALSKAYSVGDLSQVYPIARGSAPLFIVLWGAIFLAERPSAAGLLGIGVIVVGVYVINLRSLADWRRPILGFRRHVTQWALLTGVCISIYHAVDKVGVQYVHPVKYLFLILFVAWAALSPLWLIARRREALIAEVVGVGGVPAFGSIGRIAAAAVAGLAGYVFVLLALRESPVGYVGAVREVSVVIGAWIGVRFMGESGGSLRLLASGLIVCGIVLIGTGG